METFKIPTLPSEILEKISIKWLDIPYANQSDTQKLDIYVPGKNGPYPVIVHFHGGAFAFGTRRDINLEPILRGLQRGYAVVSVEYRLSGEARFPALIYDAKAAIRFLRAHATTYGLQPNKFAAWGPSAGGYLAAMIGTTIGNSAFEDLQMGNEEYSSQVQAVVDWCGPCGDFLQMDSAIIENQIGRANHKEADSPESRILGAPIATVSDLSHMASPYVHVTKDCPPFLIHHGGSDPVVPVQQSKILAEAIAQKAGKDKVHLEVFEGKGHHGEPWYEEEAITDKVFAFLDEVL